MLKLLRTYGICASALFALFGCAQNEGDILQNREEYIICFNSAERVADFKKKLLYFAEQNQFEVFDRSNAAQKELQNLDHARFVLERTNGELILITIEKKGIVRVSITNVGLKGDLNLAFRFRSNRRPPHINAVLGLVDPNLQIKKINDDTSPVPCRSPIL